MKARRSLKILNISLILALVVSALSFAFPIVPCTKAAVIANPTYSLGFCKLPNPFTEPILGISQKYYGLSTEISAGLVAQFLIVFALTILILIIVKRRSDNFMDLSFTGKK